MNVVGVAYDSILKASSKSGISQFKPAIQLVSKSLGISRDVRAIRFSRDMIKAVFRSDVTDSLKANLKQLIGSTDDESNNGSTDESTDNSTDEDESNDPTRRALAVTGLKVDYTITVPVKDNALVTSFSSR